MKHAELRERVCRVNKELAESGLVVLTWGNASGLDREAGLVAIKPSGVDYDRMGPEDIVIIELETGDVVAGEMRPSSDTPTHLELYREFDSPGGIVHTHSSAATAWAQAGRPIPCMGTTHADHFWGEVPVTRQLSQREIEVAYEENSGRVIVEHFRENGLKPDEMPAVLLPGHGPFTWGEDAQDAMENALALEEVAATALRTFLVNPEADPLPRRLLDKHFLRKHGTDAYYGQEE